MTGDTGGWANGGSGGERRVAFTLLGDSDWVSDNGPGFDSQSEARAMRSDVRNMRNSFDLMSLDIFLLFWIVVKMPAKGSHHLDPFQPNRGTPEWVDWWSLSHMKLEEGPKLGDFPAITGS